MKINHSKTGLFSSFAVALMLVPLTACTSENREATTLGEQPGEARPMESREMSEGEVIDRDTELLEQEAGKVGDRSVEQSTTDVKVRKKEQVTRTLIETHEIPTAKVCQEKADINRMDKEDFQALGFDPATSQRIVQTREQRGRFTSVEDLTSVQGVNQSRLQELSGDLTVGKVG